MSVPKPLRKQGKLEIQTLIYDFASYTNKMCSNEKIFLKRNRWCTTKALVDCVRETAVLIDIANGIRLVPKNAEERYSLQKQAFYKLIEAETLIEIAYRDNYNATKQNPTIPDKTIIQFLDYLDRGKTLLKNWMTSDKKRLQSTPKSDL